MAGVGLLRGVTMVATLALTISPAAADNTEWAIGLGAVGMNAPHYVGSPVRTNHVLPLPYVSYRGRHLKADRKGIELRSWGPIRLGISASATLPVSSSDTLFRQGMPDLLATVELGPQLVIVIVESDDGRADLTGRLAVRGAIGAGRRHLAAVGLVVEPSIQLESRDVGGWDIRMAAGPRFVSEQYADYYYQVDPEYVTMERWRYDARGGYAGARVTAAATKRFENFWAGVFARYDHLASTTFNDSPLVQDGGALVVGAGIAVIFAGSR